MRVRLKVIYVLNVRTGPVLQCLVQDFHKSGPKEIGMINKLSLPLAWSLAFAMLTGTSIAETLLGKNYIGGSFSIVNFGDDELDEVFGNAYGLDAQANINLNNNIDLNLGIGYLWADGQSEGIEIDLTGVSVGANLFYFFAPGEQVNPYIYGGIAVVKNEIEFSAFGESVTDDETEVGYVGGAGFELMFTEEVLFRFGLDYLTIDSQDTIALNIGAGYWFNETILGTLSGSYEFEDKNAFAAIGFIVKL
jgi:opacity protein-like surface antigen